MTLFKNIFIMITALFLMPVTSLNAQEDYPEIYISPKGPFLYNGPFQDNDFSMIMPYIPLYNRKSEGINFPNRNHESPNELWFRREIGWYHSQILVRRVGNAFAIRLFLHGPGVTERSEALEDKLLSLYLSLRDTQDKFESIALAYLRGNEFKEIDTDMGKAIATDWIWSPDLAYYYSTLSENYWTKFNRLWTLATDATQENRPHMFHTTPVSLYSLSPEDAKKQGKTLDEIYNRQLFGQEALDAIENAPTLISYLFGENQQKDEQRKEVIAWLKENFVPIAPYEQLLTACGKMPDRPDYVNGVITAASYQNFINRLDSHANCTISVWNKFDYASYQALYPQVIEQVAKWDINDGTYVSSQWVPMEKFISGYATVAPEDVSRVFELRLEQVDEELTDAIQRGQRAAHIEAVERAMALEDRMMEQRNQARQRAYAMQQMQSALGGGSGANVGSGNVGAGVAPSFDEIRNTDLQGMIENAKAAAETGDASMMFNENGTVKNTISDDTIEYRQQQYEAEQEAQRRDQRNQGGERGERRRPGPNDRQTGTDNNGAGETNVDRNTDDGANDGENTLEKAPPPLRDFRVYAASKFGVMNTITGRPNHGCGIPWQDNPDEGWGAISCTKVNTLELYVVDYSVDANGKVNTESMCPGKQEDRWRAEVVGPVVVGEIHEVGPLTRSEMTRALGYTDRDYFFFRGEEMDAKSTFQIRLQDYAKRDMFKPGIRALYFQNPDQGVEWIKQQGCPYVDIVPPK